MIVTLVMALVITSPVEGYQWTTLSTLGIASILFGDYLMLRNTSLKTVDEEFTNQDNIHVEINNSQKAA